MIALVFTLALFLYWGLVGFALQALFPPKLKPLTQVLVAPAVGVSATLLLVFLLNRAGFPIGSFAAVLAMILALGAVAILAWRGPAFPMREAAPFAGAALLGLGLVAWPMALYGFDWVSFTNDDMANYALGASRFLRHGFFEQPNPEALFQGRDYTQTYWYFLAGSGVRPGSELTLAAVWGATGLNSHQNFMPVIVALFLALVTGAAAMLTERANGYRAAVIAAFLLALSPLTTLGVAYQLIGQVGALALLCAAISMTFRVQTWANWREFASQNVASAIVCGGLVVWYPEALPFFGAAWIAMVGLQMWSAARATSLAAAPTVVAGAKPPRRLALPPGSRQLLLGVGLPALLIGLLVAIALNAYLINAFGFLSNQGQAALLPVDIKSTLFPYFLVPSGAAALWGLLPIAELLVEPYASLAILTGLGLSLWVVVRAFFQVRDDGQIPAVMLLIMTVLFFMFFFRNQDFPLFKLAMYLQPFLAAVVAVELAGLKRSRVGYVRIATAGAVLAACVWTQLNYTGKSTGEFFGSFNEIPRASALKVNRQFAKFAASRTPNVAMIIDTPNVVLAKFGALYTTDRVAEFPSRDYFSPLYANTPSRVRVLLNAMGSKEAFTPFEKLMAMSHVESVTRAVEGNKFVIRKNLERVADNALLVTAPLGGIFNRAQYNYEEGDYFVGVNDKHNHLIFVNSDFGHHYYLPPKGKKVAFFQLENDPMRPGKLMSALGPLLLFTTIDAPEPGDRAVVEVSATLLPQFDRVVPPVTLQGEALGAVGRGSARLFSKSVQATQLGRFSYLTLSMGRDGLRFPTTYVGLDGLYGREVPRDRRLISAFGSDISLLSAAQYDALQPPTTVESFPGGLDNKSLEYSGIYEDGWISERSFFILNRPAAMKFLVVLGDVPGVEPNFTTRATVSLDGKVVAEQTLKVGRFQIVTPVSGLEGHRRVDIAFDKVQRLPGGDGRPTSAKIEKIGFVPRPPGAGRVFQEVNVQLPSGLGDSAQRSFGIYRDRWVAVGAYVGVVAQRGDDAIRVKGSIPRLKDPAFSTSLKVSVDGKAVSAQALTPGEFDLVFPAPLTPGKHRVDLTFERGQILPGADQREVGARLDRIETVVAPR